MTISNPQASVTVQGDGVTTQFSYQFLIPAAQDVVVSITDTLVSPAVTSVVAPGLYTITGLGLSEGGLVTYPLGGTPIAAGFEITIARTLLIIQTAAIGNQGNFYPSVVEGALDYLTMVCQDLQSEVNDLTRADIEVISSITNSVATVALLKAATVSAPLVGTSIYLQGYYAANDGGGGIFLITNVNPGADNGGTIIWSNTTGYYYLRSTQGQQFSARWFGAKGDGVTNDTAAAQATVNAAVTVGGTAYFPGGIYLLNGAVSSDSKNNGILIPYRSNYPSLIGHITLAGDGKSTVLKAGTPNMYIIRLSDSYCTIQDITLDGNSLGTVSGLGLVPESTTQTNTLVFQLFNHINNIEIRNCVEGLELKCGPDVATADSGCWYNNFYDLNIFGCVRGIWLRDGTNASSSGVNRCNFFGGRIGQANCNTGIQIDAADGNAFFAMHLEGILNGTSPNATPTGIKIALAGSNSGDNNNNRFFDMEIEGVTRHLESANSYSEFYGCNIDGSKCLFTANPLIIFGGDAASYTPQIFPAQVYQASSMLAGYAAGTNYLLGSNGVSIPNGPLSIGGAVYQQTGITASIANGATFTIAIPIANKAYELSISNSGNRTLPHLSFMGSDGSSGVTPTVLAAGGVTLSVTGTVITVTNATGSSATFTWALLQRTP